MTGNVQQCLAAALMVLLGSGFPALEGVAQAETAEAFFVSEVDAIVQDKCVSCHRSGGQAASSGADLLFTSSASSNHEAFDSYVNSPTRGAKESRVLSKITGGSGHGGGQVIPQGSTEYQVFSDYLSLLTAVEDTMASAVHRVMLEEPIEGEIHSGVGNLRGWSLATDGVSKIEVFVDGAYKYNAPSGGFRADVAGAFPDIDGSDESGFSLAFNYSELPRGPHTITVVSHTLLGATTEATASFEVVRFDSTFIADPNAVNLDSGTCEIAADEISITDALVEDALYDLRLKWRTAEQGFEIIEAR